MAIAVAASDARDSGRRARGHRATCSDESRPRARALSPRSKCVDGRIRTLPTVALLAPGGFGILIDTEQARRALATCEAWRERERRRELRAAELAELEAAERARRDARAAAAAARRRGWDALESHIRHCRRRSAEASTAVTRARERVASAGAASTELPAKVRATATRSARCARELDAALACRGARNARDAVRAVFARGARGKTSRRKGKTSQSRNAVGTQSRARPAGPRWR